MLSLLSLLVATSQPSLEHLSQSERSVRRQLSWPVRVNYDGRLGFRILSGSCLF